jgi:hypothetical protein
MMSGRRHSIAPAWLPKATLLVSVGLLSACATSVDEAARCGTVSGFLEPDREADFYRVVVTHLDGKPVISKPNYQLAPGEYRFTLAELIDAPSLRVSLAARSPKELNLRVEAGTRYHLAAKFNTDKAYFGKDTGYWQPVVRQQEAHECHFDEGVPQR